MRPSIFGNISHSANSGEEGYLSVPKNRYYLVLVGFVLFGIVVGVTIFSAYFGDSNINGIYGGDKDSCPPSHIQYLATIEGESMLPMLNPGSKVVYCGGYYEVNAPKQNDLVIYDFGGSSIPVIKQVRVTDADSVFVDNSRRILVVNGSPLTNSVGELYVFTEPELSMLQGYISNNSIPEGSFFLFGDNIKVSNDSRKFGAVSRRNLIGKVISSN